MTAYRGGMAERKLYRADLAALLGIKVDSLNKLKLPERDGTDVERGKARPWWWLSTAQTWKANRPGRGVGGGRPARSADPITR